MAEGLVDDVPDMPEKLSFKHAMEAALANAYKQGVQAGYSDRPKLDGWQFVGVCVAMLLGAAGGMMGVAWVFKAMAACQ